MENPQTTPESTPENLPQPQTPEVPTPQAPPPPPAPAPAGPPETPVIPPNATPEPAPQTDQAPLAETGPALADDVDVIEKEWVDKAAEVVKKTEGDPHKEEEAVEDLQIDYLKKRYGLDVNKSKDE